MAKYMLTGVDPGLWKKFKAACSLRGCTVKESFLDHINIIVAGYQNNPDYPADYIHKRRKGDKRK